MSHEPINDWVEKTRMAGASAQAADGVQVVRRVNNQNRGNLILEIAEAIRPWLMKMFEGVRDNSGMLIQPAHVRAVALNVAHGIVKDEEQNFDA